MCEQVPVSMRLELSSSTFGDAKIFRIKIFISVPLYVQPISGQTTLVDANRLRLACSFYERENVLMCGNCFTSPIFSPHAENIAKRIKTELDTD